MNSVLFLAFQICFADPVVIDSIGDVGKYTSIGFGYGESIISYYDVTNGNLKCYIEGEIEIVDTLGNVGMYTSLAVITERFENFPCISYYDETNGDLKYAYLDSSGWNIEKVDTAGDVGLYTSVDLDSSNYPHISYYDVTNGDLKYAYWNGTYWNIEKIDTFGDVGQYSSLELDTLQYPHISYYDKTNGDLKYAHLDSSGWNIEKVDTIADVGKYTSIFINTHGDPIDRGLHITYYDSTNGDLKHAYWDRMAWKIWYSDTVGDVGKWTSLPSGPHGWGYSYYDATNKDLKFHGSPEDTEGDVGKYSSLCVPGDFLCISYYDATHGDLKLGWWGGGVEEFDNSKKPSAYLYQNYPNPVIRGVTIPYEIVKDSYVSIKIYDVTGKLVTTLVNQWRGKGKHFATWNPIELPKGIYFYQLKMGDYVTTKMMILL